MRGQDKRGKFPAAYSSIDTATHIGIFAEAPARLRAVLAGLTQADFRAKPRPEKWSIQEISFHVVDSEVMGAGRIRQVFAEPGAVFARYDQDAWATAIKYQELDTTSLSHWLGLFASLRATASVIFRTATTEIWAHWGTHGEWGPLTLRQLLELYADHGERHIGQIVELRNSIGEANSFPAPSGDKAILGQRIHGCEVTSTGRTSSALMDQNQWLCFRQDPVVGTACSRRGARGPEHVSGRTSEAPPRGQSGKTQS